MRRVIRLTRMHEKKVKGGSRGDLIHFSYAPAGPIWIFSDQIQSLEPAHGPVELDEETDETERREIALLRLAGREEVLVVAETARAVLLELGIDPAQAVED